MQVPELEKVFIETSERVYRMAERTPRKGKRINPL